MGEETREGKRRAMGGEERRGGERRGEEERREERRRGDRGGNGQETKRGQKRKREGGHVNDQFMLAICSLYVFFERDEKG